MTTAPEPMTSHDAKRLADLQNAISTKSYKRSHKTFAAYCRKEHGISRALAYRIARGKVYIKHCVSPSVRWAIWERDDFRCHYCGSRQFLTVDHVIPEAHGGDQHESNLITACKSCNSRKATIPYNIFHPPMKQAFEMWRLVTGSK